MSNAPDQKDLIVLVADKDAELTVKGLLPRHQAFGIRPISKDVYSHPEHDPGCLLRGHEFLRSFIHRYAYAIVMLDREGCGKDAVPGEDLEKEIEERLADAGWKDRSTAIVLDPELEIWVWAESPQVDAILGWEGRQPDLRTWLVTRQFIQEKHTKPQQPKSALEKALREVRQPRSSAIYGQLAKQVSFRHCIDRAFVKFWTTLQHWFSEDTQ